MFEREEEKRKNKGQWRPTVEKQPSIGHTTSERERSPHAHQLKWSERSERKKKKTERDAAELVAVDGAVVGPGRCGGHVKSAWTGLLPMPGWWARPREQARKRFTPTTTHLLSGAEGTPPAACFRRRRLTNQRPTVTAMAMAPRRCKLEMEKRGFPLTVAS